MPMEPTANTEQLKAVFNTAFISEAVVGKYVTYEVDWVEGDLQGGIPNCALADALGQRRMANFTPDVVLNTKVRQGIQDGFGLSPYAVQVQHNAAREKMCVTIQGADALAKLDELKVNVPVADIKCERGQGSAIG